MSAESQQPTPSAGAEVASQQDAVGGAAQPALGAKLLARGRSSELSTGQRFETKETLGVGATGRVMAVRDHNLDRDIAMKVLVEPDEAPAIARFVSEARTVASLSHPNVLPVHDLDLDEQGRLFFTMTRIAGTSLGVAIEASAPGRRAARIRSANDVVNIFLGVARAVAYAHHRRLIHQDIKPDNIMLGEFGEVILVDWGSAARLDDGHGRTDAIYGTPLYMSPEQARREYADERSDIYSIGCTLFHALLLRVPTWSGDAEEFLRRKRQGIIEPPSAEERRAVPAALLDIALMAIQPDPAQRYASAEDLLRDLERFQAGLAVAAHRESWWTRFRRWYAANTTLFWVSGVAVLALLATAALAVQRHLEGQAAWRPVLTERFDEPSLADLDARWAVRTKLVAYPWPTTFSDASIADPSAFALTADGMVSSASNAILDLTTRDGFVGDLRVEWDYAALKRTRNLNCLIGGRDRNAAFTFHVAGWDRPTLVVLTRDDGILLAQSRLPGELRIGHRYHFTLEHEARHLRLAIDGTTLIDYLDAEDIGATSPQHVGFDNYPENRLAITNVRILHRSPAQRISPLEIGDKLYQLRHWDDAESQYQDLIGAYPGSDLATAAQYRIACCEQHLGHAAEAARRLDAFSAEHQDSDLVPYALAQRLQLAIADHDAAGCARLRAALTRYPGHPVLVQVLTDIGHELAGSLAELGMARFDDPCYPPDILARVDAQVAAMRQWSRVYRTQLEMDPLLECAGHVLLQLGESRRALQISESSQVQADAHYALGDLERLASDDLRDLGLATEARLALGRFAEVAGDETVASGDRALALFYAGDRQGLEALDPNGVCAWVLRLAEGHFDEYLAAHPRDDRGADYGMTLRAAALMGLRRYDQILAEYRHPSVVARVLLAQGRPEEALKAATFDEGLAAMAAVQELEDGKLDEARALLARLAAMPTPYDHYDSACASCLLPAVVQAILGDAAGARAVLRARLAHARDTLAQRLWYMIAYALGDIDDRAFLEQPFRLQADARLLFAQGLRAEIDGASRAAAERYRQLLSMPIHRAIIPEFGRRFMEWRLRAQGIAPPPVQSLPFNTDM